MGVLSMIGKVVLVITNIVFLLLSLASTIIGVIIIAGKDVYKPLLDDWKDDLKSVGTDLGLTIDTSSLSISDFLTPFGYALITFGVVVGSLALLGCIGSCCSFKVVLIVYSLITSILLLVQVVLVILIYADKSAFDRTLKPYIKDTLDHYGGIEDTSAKSLAWNALMNYEKCCGVDDYEDFTGLSKWPAPINGNNYNLKTPVICCKSKSTDFSCAETPTDANNHWKTGCYKKLFDLILDNNVVVPVVAAVIGAQAILIFFAIWIVCTMNNKIGIV